MKKLGAVFLICMPLNAPAQELNIEALSEIRAFAEDFCGDLFDSGSSSGVSVEGSAEARLKGLLDKLADLGIEGSAGFDQEKYVGVIREELGKELQSNRDCRLTVWNDLKAAVLKMDEASTSPATGGGSAPAYRYPFTQTQWLDAANLSGYSKAELRIMRNEIYARYGYSFKSADLRAYFGGQPWYTPQTTDAEAAYKRMTAIERSNVLTIREAEASR